LRESVREPREVGRRRPLQQQGGRVGDGLVAHEARQAEQPSVVGEDREAPALATASDELMSERSRSAMSNATTCLNPVPGWDQRIDAVMPSSPVEKKRYGAVQCTSVSRGNAIAPMNQGRWRGS
jgi:hypothetical protein